MDIRVTPKPEQPIKYAFLVCSGLAKEFYTPQPEQLAAQELLTN